MKDVMEMDFVPDTGARVARNKFFIMNDGLEKLRREAWKK